MLLQLRLRHRGNVRCRASAQHQLENLQVSQTIVCFTRVIIAKYAVYKLRTRATRFSNKTTCSGESDSRRPDFRARAVISRVEIGEIWLVKRYTPPVLTRRSISGGRFQPVTLSPSIGCAGTNMYI